MGAKQKITSGPTRVRNAAGAQSCSEAKRRRHKTNERHKPEADSQHATPVRTPHAEEPRKPSSPVCYLGDFPDW